MSFCVTISGADDAIGKMIYNQWKFYRDTNVQISIIEDNIMLPLLPCRLWEELITKIIEHDENFDDTEEWYMSEYEFREWYFTHSHKYTMAFYNFFMEDEGNFRKIAPQVVEKELYKLWKDDPVLFTDMVNEFEDEDEDEYTFA